MPDDAARFLADSPDRLALLDRLREGPAGPATLAEDLDCARRSVQRNLAAFAERDWVRRGDGGYHLTTVGDLVARTHADYLDRLDAVAEFAPLLGNLDPAHAPDPGLLAGGDLTVASAEHPQAPVHAYVDRLRAYDGDAVRVCSPVLSRIFHEAHASLAVRGVHTELVLSAETAERARELNPLEFAAVLRTGVLDLYAHPDPIPLGLAVGDELAVLAAYDDEGHLAACLESTEPDLVDWAAATLDRLRAAADPVEPDRGSPFGLGPG